MYTGTVKLFKAEEGKRFGFIRNEEGEEIFFHFNNGEFIIPGKTEPEFSGNKYLVVKGKPRRLRDPQPGDILVFWHEMGRKGWMATPWGYKENYDHALKIISERPEPIIYRALETMNSTGEKPGESKILWEGSDLDELLKKYPVPSGRQSPSADPLLPYWGDPDNIFETRHWFEKKTESGWEKCPDPRPLSGCNRQFEHIANRI